MYHFRHHTLLFIFLIAAFFSYAQTGKTTTSGTLADGSYLSGKNTTPVKFKKAFKTIEDAYVTTYTVYDKTGKKPLYTVTAYHSPMLQKVIVTLEDLSVKDNDPQIGDHTVLYEQTTTEPFGTKHMYRTGRWEAKVKFANAKKQYVQVMEVMGDMMKDEFVLLDK
jgi:hypothetical protein